MASDLERDSMKLIITTDEAAQESCTLAVDAQTTWADLSAACGHLPDACILFVITQPESQQQRVVESCSTETVWTVLRQWLLDSKTKDVQVVTKTDNLMLQKSEENKQRINLLLKAEFGEIGRRRKALAQRMLQRLQARDSSAEIERLNVLSRSLDIRLRHVVAELQNSSMAKEEKIQAPLVSTVEVETNQAKNDDHYDAPRRQEGLTQETFVNASLPPPPFPPPLTSSTSITSNLDQKSVGTDMGCSSNPPEWFARNSLEMRDDILDRLRYMESRIYNQLSDEFKAAHEHMQAKLKQDMQSYLRDELAPVKAHLSQQLVRMDAIADLHRFITTESEQRDALFSLELKSELNRTRETLESVVQCMQVQSARMDVLLAEKTEQKQAQVASGQNVVVIPDRIDDEITCVKLGKTDRDQNPTSSVAVPNFSVPDFVADTTTQTLPVAPSSSVEQHVQPQPPQSSSASSSTTKSNNTASLQRSRATRRRRYRSDISSSSSSSSDMEIVVKKSTVSASPQVVVEQVTVVPSAPEEAEQPKIQVQTQQQAEADRSQSITNRTEAEDDSDTMSSVVVLRSRSPSVLSYAKSLRSCSASSSSVAGDGAANDYVMLFKDQQNNIDNSASTLTLVAQPTTCSSSPPLLPIVVHPDDVYSYKLDDMQVSDADNNTDDVDDDDSFEDEEKAFERLRMQVNENDKWIVGQEALAADLTVSVSSSGGTTTTTGSSSGGFTNISIKSDDSVKKDAAAVEQVASNLSSMNVSFTSACSEVAKPAGGDEQNRPIVAPTIVTNGGDGIYDSLQQNVKVGVSTLPLEEDVQIEQCSRTIPYDTRKLFAKRVFDDEDHQALRGQVERELAEHDEPEHNVSPNGQTDDNSPYRWLDRQPLLYSSSSSAAAARNGQNDRDIYQVPSLFNISSQHLAAASTSDASGIASVTRVSGFRDPVSYYNAVSKAQGGAPCVQQPQPLVQNERGGSSSSSFFGVHPTQDYSARPAARVDAVNQSRRSGPPPPPPPPVSTIPKRRLQPQQPIPQQISSPSNNNTNYNNPDLGEELVLGVGKVASQVYGALASGVSQVAQKVNGALFYDVNDGTTSTSVHTENSAGRVRLPPSPPPPPPQASANPFAPRQWSAQQTFPQHMQTMNNNSMPNNANNFAGPFRRNCLPPMQRVNNHANDAVPPHMPSMGRANAGGGGSDQQQQQQQSCFQILQPDEMKRKLNVLGFGSHAGHTFQYPMEVGAFSALVNNLLDQASGHYD